MNKIFQAMLTHVCCVGFLSVLCFFMIASCGDGSDEDESAVTQEQLTSLENEIRTIIGEAECTETAQCHSIGFGSKPCGGCWEYLIYSTIDTDTSLLEDKVHEYNQLEEIYNSENDIVSTCDVVMKPEVICDEGTCSTTD